VKVRAGERHRLANAKISTLGAWTIVTKYYAAPVLSALENRPDSLQFLSIASWDRVRPTVAPLSTNASDVLDWRLTTSKAAACPGIASL